MKTFATLLLALALVGGGALLARYAEVDDAPGGVVIGGVVALTGVGIGVGAFRGRKA